MKNLHTYTNRTNMNFQEQSISEDARAANILLQIIYENLTIQFNFTLM